MHFPILVFSVPLYPRLDNMGFFKSEKSVEDVENGSELKADDSTNIQGQTDAVFGEVVEGGPNYRNVCSPPFFLPQMEVSYCY